MSINRRTPGQSWWRPGIALMAVSLMAATCENKDFSEIFTFTFNVQNSEDLEPIKVFGVPHSRGNHEQRWRLNLGLCDVRRQASQRRQHHPLGGSGTTLDHRRWRVGRHVCVQQSIHQLR